MNFFLKIHLKHKDFLSPIDIDGNFGKKLQDFERIAC